MNREIFPYTNESDWLRERSKDITSTTVSALFGLNPRLTAFELFHRLRNGIAAEHVDNERTVWGKRLQSAIADGVALENQWQIRAMQEYVRIPEHRVGSSFDYCEDTGTRRETAKLANPPDFLLEVKNVDGLIFKQGWIEDPDIGIVAPDHIELQAQHECLVAGIGVCYIAALVGGNRVHVLRREYQPDVGDVILRAAAAFWAGPEPAPDFRRDAAFVGRLHGYSEPGAYLDATGDEHITRLMHEYHEAGQREREAESDRKAAKAELLTLIGKAEKVVAGEFLLSAKMVGAAVVESYTREAYRGFRVNQKGVKQ